jgi:hypothetical protein
LPPLLLALISADVAIAHEPSPNGRVTDLGMKSPPGVYYPKPYFSRAYLQAFELVPGQAPLHFRLQPWDNYARFRHGVAAPGLTSGSVEADLFAYRYADDFTTTYQPIQEARRATAAPVLPQATSAAQRRR